MEPAPIQMLEELPDDLRSGGWQLVREDTDVYQLTDSVQYIAVYERPFDVGVDDLQALSTMPEDRGSRARVSTNQAGSASWEQAYRDAIEMMREVDGRRRERA